MTAVYIPDDEVLNSGASTHLTKINVVVNDTFSEAAKMSRRGIRPCCLNFASHKRPGGGYKGKAKAQEEDLFRRSNLPRLLDNREVRQHYPLNHGSFFCPRVVVIKDAQLLPITNFEVSVITKPAPYDPKTDEEYLRRAERVLEIAANYGESHLILGAWGCGVFKCSPWMAASVWKSLLGGRFQGGFEQVTFAILDMKGDNYRTFLSILS